MSTNWHNVRSSVPKKNSIWAHQNNIAHGSRNRLSTPNQSSGINRTISQDGLQDKSNQNYYNIDYSRRLYKNQIQEEYIRTRPLERGLKQPKSRGFVVFKGLSATVAMNKIFKPTHERISNVAKNYTLDVLKSIDASIEQEFQQHIPAFIKEVKSNPELRERLHISKSVAESLSEDALISLPKRNILHRFVEAALAPVSAPARALTKLIFKNTDAVKRSARLDSIIKNYAKVLDNIDNVNHYENSFRKSQKITAKKFEDAFLIPFNDLKDKLRRRRTKSFNPSMGQYSTKVLGPGNRVISGLIGAAYLSNDAYNTTMHLTGEKDTSVKERRSRFFQETARIGMSAYLMGIGLTLFKKKADRSMLAALGVTGAITFLSEVLGRRLVGKAVLPSDKETLDEMDKKRRTAKGVLPSIGRFLTGEKIEKIYNNTVRKITLSSTQINSRFDTSNTFVNFTRNSKTISFTGIPFKAHKVFNAKELSNLVELLENINPAWAKHTKTTVQNGLKKLGEFEGKDISKMSFENAVQELSQVPIGTKGTKAQMIAKTFAAPYFWVEGAVKAIKNLATVIKHKINKISDDELLAHYKKQLKPEMEEIFEEFAKERKALPYWNQSHLSEKQKEIGLIKDFIKIGSSNAKEEVEGVKNTLLWLKKNYDSVTKGKNVTLEEFVEDVRNGGNKYSKELGDLRNRVKSQTLRAFSQGNTEYDTSKFSVINVNVARAITTGFLVSDAYNLTMQHSNDNRGESVRNGKKRAVQEGARIAVSAYIMNFFYTWWSKFINASLLGAFTTTAITSNLNEISSRGVVGIPISPKSQDELDKIADKIQNSKNPVRKTLQYLIGKRCKLHKKDNTATVSRENCTSNAAATSFLSQDFELNNNSSNDFIKGYIQRAQMR